MRLLLDLREVAHHAELRRLASEADDHGIWGIVVSAAPGAECLEAAAIAATTNNVSILIDIDGDAAHPTTLAEEIAVVDQISHRRTMALLRGLATHRSKVAALLSGLPVDGLILAPPPAQASIPVYAPEDIPAVSLDDGSKGNAVIVDQHRDSNTPFLIISWTGPIKGLARHLVGRASSTDFPQMIADLADQIDPIE